VARQLTEVLEAHRNLDTARARRVATDMLVTVGIPDAEQRIDAYPHQLSGGMRQRVMIAMALLCAPKVLIADEPTTALDVTLQAQILHLFSELKREFGASIVLITHDLGVVAALADRVAVMYAGRIVETGTVFDIFERPRHPYTKALLDSTPRPDMGGDLLTPIGGSPPNLQRMPPGCAFHPRCPAAAEICARQVPALQMVDGMIGSACFLDGHASRSALLEPAS
ncbi:MAG: ABC transporter ATP-binding protein, partial [Alphaproteobacteria bacterium]